MDTNTDSQQMQEQADSEKEALGLANSFMEQLMPEAPIEEGSVPVEAPTEAPTDAPVSPETAPQEAQPAQEAQPTTPDPNEAKIAELELKITEMEKSTKDTIRAEIGEIKDMIQEALSEEK